MFDLVIDKHTIEQNLNKGFTIKIQSLILFFVISMVCRGEERVLKPLNPSPIMDNAFVAKIDLGVGMPKTEPWVRFLPGFWESDPFDDNSSSVYVGKSREAELRLFLVKEGASFDDISREIKFLVSVGFRPTTLRHLIAFCNTKNAKNLNMSIVFLASECPVISVDSKERSRIDGFYSAVMMKGGIVVGLVLPNDLAEISEKIVLLEAPFER